jgi:hypothetical protein
MPPELKALKNKAEQKKQYEEAALDSLKASIPLANKSNEEKKNKQESKVETKEDEPVIQKNFSLQISLSSTIENIVKQEE